MQLESAALDLITSQRSVLDIALDAGFESHEGFTRAFASHFGMPPTELRVRHAHLAADATNAALIHQLGPCIGLFRTHLTQEPIMNYDITRQPIPEPTTLYVEWGPGMVTIHAGLAIATAPSQLPDGMLVKTLPACEAAVAIHTGSYDGLADAHAAIDQFLDDQRLSKAGPAREVYLTDPGEVPDPAQWKTQVLWPVRAVS